MWIRASLKLAFGCHVESVRTLEVLGFGHYSASQIDDGLAQDGVHELGAALDSTDRGKDRSTTCLDRVPLKRVPWGF